MPRKSIPSTTLLAQVRNYFGLEQQELAAYLGLSRQHVAHIEAGRRTLTSQVLLQLSPLAALLPTEEAVQPATLTPDELPPALPAPGPLEDRLDVCRHQAAKLRRELQKLTAAQAQARRWQRVLPGLLAQTVAPIANQAQQWLLHRQEATEGLLNDTDQAARYHLLRLRAEALETEAAGLAALLASTAAEGKETS